MRFTLSTLSILTLNALGVHCAWPDGPLFANGRYIQNSLGNNVTYAGVNWPGAADVMIPEGLQYLSISKIISDIKSVGFNAVRLTFAIEMVDDILDNGGDVKLSAAFDKALGTTNGSTVYNKVLQNNPSFSASTTRLQVFDAIAAECFKQQIYVHLDNHMSNGAWCCSSDDGNTWFGDTYFDVEKWKRGLEYMVNHGKNWPALTSMGMRNELRDPTSNSTLHDTYTWPVWKQNMNDAANIVNSANEDILIFFSGLNFDTQLRPIVEGQDLGNGVKWSKTDFPFSNKLVFELHDYENSITSCTSLENNLEYNGFETLRGTQLNTMPMALTEWGHDQGEGSGVYASCLRSYLPQQKVSWFLWVIAGSYYIRTGTQDYDETWGLYKHDWSGWRNETNVADLKTAALATNS